MPIEQSPSVAIIGAGASGIAYAIALRKRYGFENFTIYEKASDVGGTWRDNVYPGCSSDVPMILYSLSSDIRDWPQSHGSQEDIWEYWKSVTLKNNLYPHIRFNHKMVVARWNAEHSVYQLALTNTVTGELIEATANILISAVGVLEVPRYADIPGMGAFAGDIFHSARWDKSVELSGKRVGVIGNGSSATQFVPEITKDPSVDVVEFCREPQWLLRPLRTKYTSFRRFLFRNVPFLSQFWRLVIFLRSELMYFIVLRNGSMFHSVATKIAKSYISKTAPKDQVKDLIPKYPLGCKRIIIDTGYLDALHRPNLRLNWDGVESIVGTGIITKAGETIPLDVLIFATGYAADTYPLPVHGSHGQSIQEVFSVDGARAYLGVTTPGFPNFFFLGGPNTATGHTSAIFTSECQVEYSLQLIGDILNGQAKSLEVKQKVFDDYNDFVQKWMEGSVFTQCTSWYRAGKVGNVTALFPGSGIRFWWLLRKANVKDYIFS